MTHKRSSRIKPLGVVGIVLIILVISFVFTYFNINRILTTTFQNGFKNTLVAEVYELKFKNLEVNLFTGSISVVKVEMCPREKQLHHYGYINSSFRFEARKIVLKNVSLFKLLFTNKLVLKKIEIIEPDIDFTIADVNLLFFPFKDIAANQTDKDKPSIDTYVIEELSMVDAHFHVVNAAQLREFDIQRINVLLKEMTIEREPGRDKIAYQHFDFSLGNLTGHLKNKELRYVNFQDFKIKMDSLYMEETPDTLIYHFSNANSSMQNVDIQTADSLFHITMASFNLNYKNRSVEFNDLSFKPNISDAALQRKYVYRKEHFAGTVGSIDVTDIDFDSLMYAHKIVVREILLDDVSGSIYKDLTKPFPPNHRPEYLAQQIQGYSTPIAIQHIKVTKANLVNTEVKPDGGIGKANINRGTLDIENITNLPTTEKLIIHADAYVENTAHVYLQLGFNYDKSQYSIDGRIEPFDIPSLNAFTNSYAPARITKGIADGITFSGKVYRTYSAGTMKFLYHDLVFDMDMEDKAGWKSTIMELAANTFINGSNPSSPNQPDRVVQFHVDRDMRTGFINMLVKSVLDGVKQTLKMSKENKKVYRTAKEDLKIKIKEINKN